MAVEEQNVSKTELPAAWIPELLIMLKICYPEIDTHKQLNRRSALFFQSIFFE